ncbi:hypothetical protein GH714_025710 [Hevea brasiliensis]|uniref:Nudix hydrolase domain-containing protein n=1 Tax=Hevea brasiliensis TaxID=3981 RepID=A0A6A6LLY5_HEVBR|nr:hypothetical protein GH714_025710 [Hevea brasiliensis]
MARALGYPSAGHISAGDSSLVSARSELHEELGIVLPKDAFELIFVFLQEWSCLTINARNLTLTMLAAKGLAISTTIRSNNANMGIEADLGVHAFEGPPALVRDLPQSDLEGIARPRITRLAR